MEDVDWGSCGVRGLRRPQGRESGWTWGRGSGKSCLVQLLSALGGAAVAQAEGGPIYVDLVERRPSWVNI